jgi:hypothetical protein
VDFSFVFGHFDLKLGGHMHFGVLYSLKLLIAILRDKMSTFVNGDTVSKMSRFVVRHVSHPL